MPPPQSSEQQKSKPNIGGFFSRLGKQLDTFWQRVTEGLEIQALWTQFVSEARASYDLYSREVDWEALARETRGRRVLKTASALFWAMIMKLSPARRVFLLIALFFAIAALSGSQVTISISEHRYEAALPNNFLSVLLAVAALLFLLALELADRVTMKRDLEIAREIQRWLVPEVPPQVPGVDIAFASRPANTVGGDYYDAFLREIVGPAAASQPLLLVVADVAGKSVPAALLMATFQASLRTLAAAPTSLVELVAGMNRYACAHSLGGRRFTTAFFAELDPATRALSYIRAGHDVPVLRRASGRFERLDAGHLPLGIDPGARYEGHTTTLAPGDLLLIFTDGLTEAVNEKDQEYGESRLLEALHATTGGSAERTLKNLMAAVETFVGHTPQQDDITCLVVRIL
jgi:serine phosphatase RsbU (regulator of sigma subunit)